MENKARPRSGWTRFILVYGLPDARFPSKGFSKNILHPEGWESISAERFFVRLRLIFHSTEKKSVSCAKRFSFPYKVWLEHGLKDARIKVQWVNDYL